MGHEKEQEPVVIVGMGGGGLSAAIKLIQEGKKVVIFENRDYFTRPQRIFLHGDSATFVDSLIDPNNPLDMKFKNSKISVDDGSVRVRSVQKFLLRKLKEEQEKHPELVEIKHGKKFKIKEIDPSSQTLDYLEDGKQVKVNFSHFIEADGARHMMADLLNDSAKRANSPPYLKFDLQQVQHRHPPCGVIQCKINLPENPLNQKRLEELIGEFTRGVVWKISDCEALIKQGWDKPYFPRHFIYGDSTQMKLGIATEIPEQLLKDSKINPEQFQANFLEWARLFIDKRINMMMEDSNTSEEDKEILRQIKPENIIILPKLAKGELTEDKKDYVRQIKALNTTAFPLDYVGADRPSVMLGKKEHLSAWR